ncbi:hypothetical protein Cob_v004796 [Colletotrichum orbiculare MAFF 240422]|uniref:Uncharacterized protein n=1 Tax=Colletotrichum orbiculare (strain 104-T / ATCC 96160 / CBS 514.97 / LARS 414 / MAFF 240422) TaxID=1213857 RepID=A0A484FVY6_COLOR|nr:hypothetical protein Cob_v004796 [Colletotrichum orbiculare MAFF 240422]
MIQALGTWRLQRMAARVYLILFMAENNNIIPLSSHIPVDGKMKPFLPTEILDHIGQVAVPSWSTLRNLTLVDRRFYAVFTHCLYEAAVAEHHPGPTCCAASTGNLAALKLAAKHGANFDAIYPQGIAGKEYDVQRAKQRNDLVPLYTPLYSLAKWMW